jgi:fermentation-respiration switch protein FrsA (DUF1100 family)
LLRKIAEYADHITRAVEIPYQGKSLPGWLHLPPTYRPGDRVPCVIVVGGMDSTKEISVALTGDQMLSRGIAVFLFDGPGPVQFGSAWDLRDGTRLLRSRQSSVGLAISARRRSIATRWRCVA